jgi:beta-N-acetylhexosaminidase
MTPLGPVMLDVAGTRLTAEEREVLGHPLAGGVILFARNYESPEQLKALTAEIRAARDPHLLIAVDQEGGRVQRFQAGFTRLPPMGVIGRMEAGKGKALARAIGRVLAEELAAHGVDFSFAPVLDVDFGRSGVIGDRAFASNGGGIAEFAGEFVSALHAGGVAAVGKHFPGHGWAEADSHHAVPTDERELSALEGEDLVPYKSLIPLGLDAVMPAHVIYPRVDSRPAGFSPVWLKEILRGRFRFDGLIFSDDLSMEGASVAGGVVERCEAALEAGCDMALVCNAPKEAAKALDGLRAAPVTVKRIDRMRARPRTAQSSAAHAQALEAFRSALA